mgnify:CR=1 FL=1
MNVMFVANKDITLYLFRRELLEKIIQKGNNVYIVCPQGSKLKYFIELGCIHIDICLDRRGKNPFNELKTILQLNKIIKKYCPDFVYSYTIKPNLYVGIVRRIKKFMYIPTVTGLGTVVNKKGILSLIIKYLYKVSFKKVDMVYFQNANNLEWFSKNVSSKYPSRLVPGSGVNLSHFYYQEMTNDKNTTFLYLGRIMKEKGIDELLEAAIFLKAKYDDKIKFRFAGFFEENYESRFNSLNNVIEYIGFIDDTREELSRCSALVLPSYHEGLSNVLLEAQATGRPVLASNIPGCIETFIEGISGFSFESKNSKSLISCLEKFHLLQFESKREMGIAGREHVERNYNREIIVNSYLELLKGGK